MSLVHEALQKAGREKLRKTGVPPAPAQKPPPGPAQPLSAVVPKPVESVTAMSVASTFAVEKSVEQLHAPVTQKKQSVLLPALIVCVAVVAIVAIVFLVSLAASVIRDSRQTVHASGDTSPTSAAAAEPTGKEPATPPPGASHAASVASDSAAPQPPPTVTDPRFRLTGITRDADGKYTAIINGQLRSEDQYIDGATVKNIQRDRVTLDENGREFVLRLY